MDKKSIEELVRTNIDYGVVGLTLGVTVGVIAKVSGHEIFPFVTALAMTAGTDLIGYSRSLSLIEEVKNDPGSFLGMYGGLYAAIYLDKLANFLGN